MLHHLSPLSLSCHSSIGRLFVGLTNWEDGGEGGGVVAYPGPTTLIAIRCEYSSVAFKVKNINFMD